MEILLLVLKAAPGPFTGRFHIKGILYEDLCKISNKRPSMGQPESALGWIT